MIARMRTLALLVVLASLSCRRRHPPPPPPRPEGQLLHVENAPGVPVVDIHTTGDGGVTHVQIGAARVDLPGANGGPPMPTAE